MAAIINLEENIGKVVGKRVPPKDALMSYMKTAEESRRWKAAFGTHAFRKVFIDSKPMRRLTHGSGR